ncbi:hypothetical protein HMPREF0988_02082 [Lachnospiraceae bacterium 1_4_56FAA]|nr:hypothetical protein HMPREF0988_02082 [Lachnospiraceae bacterium 1_4_56FAA]
MAEQKKETELHRGADRMPCGVRNGQTRETVRADGAREHGVQAGRMFAKSADGSGKRELGS